MQRSAKKRVVVVTLELIIVALLLIGISDRNSTLHVLFHSYFADLFLPFGFYFLLSPNEYRMPILRYWWMKSTIIFCAAAFAEAGQYFGIHILGRTFDPIDFVMYGSGALLAALVERGIFNRIFTFWDSRVVIPGKGNS